jgi:hypothetical protein
MKLHRFAVWAEGGGDVRYWHKADITIPPDDVRFEGKADIDWTDA